MAIIIEELTPEMVWERYQNSNSYKNSFSIEGIEAIFNYFETIEIDHEYEMFDLIGWHCMFYEADSSIDFLKEVEPDVYEELKEKYSEDDLLSEAYNYIEQNYDWAEVVGDDCHVLVHYER